MAEFYYLTDAEAHTAQRRYIAQGLPVSLVAMDTRPGSQTEDQYGFSVELPSTPWPESCVCETEYALPNAAMETPFGSPASCVSLTGAS